MVELRLPQMHLKSVCLCELWQEGGAYEKTARWLLLALSCRVHPSSLCYPLILLISHSWP